MEIVLRSLNDLIWTRKICNKDIVANKLPRKCHQKFRKVLKYNMKYQPLSSVLSNPNFSINYKIAFAVITDSSNRCVGFFSRFFFREWKTCQINGHQFQNWFSTKAKNKLPPKLSSFHWNHFNCKFCWKTSPPLTLHRWSGHGLISFGCITLANGRGAMIMKFFFSRSPHRNGQEMQPKTFRQNKVEI